MTQIKVTYSSIDRVRKSRTFKTLAGAQNWARYWVGKTPELGSGYAVSFDGVGKITVTGATLAEMFPGSAPETVENDDAPMRAWCDGYLPDGYGYQD
jgi:hypothetical protein